jgi:NTE family protein
MVNSPRKIGLSLSGGGYRAAAFHLGTLRKLNQMGILDEIAVISTISGGSIVGAAWGVYEGDYDAFHNEMIDFVTKRNVIREVLFSFITIRALLFLLFFLGIFGWWLFTPLAPVAPVFLLIMVHLLLSGEGI